MTEQIIMHKDEVLWLLRQVHDISAATSRCRDCLIDGHRKQAKEQLDHISNYTFSIIRYFEQEHRIGIKPRL